MTSQRAPTYMAERVKDFYEIIQDKEIDQETVREIVVQVLLPGV